MTRVSKVSDEDRRAMLLAIEQEETPLKDFVREIVGAPQEPECSVEMIGEGLEDWTQPDEPEGAVRHDEGKARFDLISPWFLQELAGVLAQGATKYSDRNWEKGMTMGRAFASLQRHLWAFWDGQDFDTETGLQHIAHAAFNLMVISDQWRRIKDGRLSADIDDRPFINRAPRQGEPRS